MLLGLALLLLLAASAATSPTALSVATTYTVNSEADWEDADPSDGVCRTTRARGRVCTLRAAIEQANANEGRDTINFAIPGPGAHRIQPATRLPDVEYPAVIDGYSQPGARANTLATGSNAVILIELDGRDVPRPDGRTFFYTPYDTAGIYLVRGPSLLRGLAINRFQNAIVLAGFEHVVTGNYVGLSAAGTEAPGNEVSGVHVLEGRRHTVGGGPAERNVIAANRRAGVFINSFGRRTSEAGPRENRIVGNYVGTDPAGLRAHGNGVGVEVVGHDNVIERNVVSASAEAGIYAVPGSGVRVVDNLIGTDVTGRAALGNGTNGFYAIFGHDRELSGNTISGNRADGIRLEYAGSSIVTGNRIGTSSDGTLPLPNHASGVWAESGSIRIGGNKREDGNVISANADHGVLLTHTTRGGGPPQARIEGNRIGTDASGEAMLGNEADGILMRSGHDFVVSRNVVSANGRRGIHVDGRFSGDNIASDNIVGTDVSGTRALPNASDGIRIACTDCRGTDATRVVVAENLVSGNSGSGITVAASSNAVRENLVGTDGRGLAALPNGRAGLVVSGDANLISANVISANRGFGLELVGPLGDGPQQNQVIGNLIGTDRGGESALGNAAGGVRIENGVRNDIGGPTPKQWNVISANGSNPRHRIGGRQPGVAITGRSAANRVRGNLIGTDVTGTVALGNNGDGVSLACWGPDCPDGETIGGTTIGAANVIFGNQGSGVALNPGTRQIRIQGNRIGADRAGRLRVPNREAGVLVWGATDIDVGGEEADAGNVVFGNTPGVSVLGEAAQAVRILSNFIEANSGLGIDLGNDAVTPNDAADVDVGPNDLQNYPVLTSARTAAAGTTVYGVLNSAPHEMFLVEFFLSTACDPSGFGEGQRLLGRARTRLTDAAGNVEIKVTFDEAVRPGMVVTATATDLDLRRRRDAGGGTSEFSACIVVGTGPPTPTDGVR